MHKKQVCVCISGQTRNPSEPMQSLAKLLRGVDATVVVSTWSGRGKKRAGPLTGWQLRRMLPDLAVDVMPIYLMGDMLFKKLPVFENYLLELERNLDPVSVSDYLDIFSEAIVDVQDESAIQIPQSWGEPVVKNSYLMFYKYWRCNHLRRDYEIRSHVQHSFVLRMRPDVFIESVNFEVKNLEHDNVEVNWSNESGVDDALAIMTPAAANVMADIWAVLDNDISFFLGKSAFNPHRTLETHLRANNLKPVPMRRCKAWLHADQLSYSEFQRCVAESSDIVPNEFKGQLYCLDKCLSAQILAPTDPLVFDLLDDASRADPDSFAPYLIRARALASFNKSEAAKNYREASSRLMSNSNDFGRLVNEIERFAK